MEQALDTLPDSLEAMYADVLMRQIPKDYREKARLMLMWLSYSIRPLTLRELASVASLPEPMDVRRICTSSLVTLSREHIRSSKQRGDTSWSSPHRMPDSEEDVVKFDHFSVKEYMISERLRASRGDPASYFYVSPLIAHLSIAQLSVSRILDTNGSQFTLDDIKFYQSGELPGKKVDIFYQYSDDSSSEQDIDVVEQDIDMASKEKAAMEIWQRFPLLEYSTFWHRHVWEADAIDTRLAVVEVTKPKLSELKAEAQPRLSQSEELRIQIHSLFSNGISQGFKNWALLLRHLTTEISGYDLVEVPSPIWYATVLNLPDSVQRLLQYDKTLPKNKSLKCFFRRQAEWDQTPLQIAAIQGHLKVLGLLLETDVRVEQPEFFYLVRDFKRNGSAVLDALLKARPHLTITERIVQNLWYSPVQNEIYRYILDSPSLVNLTEAMFVFIVKDFNSRRDPLTVDVGLVETIMRRGEDIGYSRGEIVEASVQGKESGRDSELVIDRCKKPPMSQSVFGLLVANENCGADMLAIVLEHYQSIHFGQDLLVSIVANRCHGADMFATVLKNYKGIHISQDLLVAAGNSTWYGSVKVFELIFEYDKNVKVSESALKAAAKNTSRGEEMFLAILNHDQKVEVSEDTLKTAATNTCKGAGIFSAILSHNKKIEITEDIIKAAATNDVDGARIFSAILTHDRLIEISEDTLIAAGGNAFKGADMFLIMFSHNKTIIISMEVMVSIAENYILAIHITNLLIDHANCEMKDHRKSPEELMGRDWDTVLKFEGCEKHITREMMKAAARWEPDAIAFLTAHKRSNVTFVKSTTQPTSDDQTS